jgi:hypothetical protein
MQKTIARHRWRITIKRSFQPLQRGSTSGTISCIFSKGATFTYASQPNEHNLFFIVNLPDPHAFSSNLPHNTPTTYMSFVPQWDLLRHSLDWTDYLGGSNVVVMDAIDDYGRITN